MARPARPPYSASCAITAPGLRCADTSTTSAASWSLVCSCSRSRSVWSELAFAAPATSRAANGAIKSFFDMGTPDGCLCGKVGTRRVPRQRDGATGQRPPARRFREAPLPALDDQAARERVCLDHALPLAESRLEPAAGHPVLALWRALDREIRLVAHLAAVGCVAQLERAFRIDAQLQVAVHRLGAQVTVLGAGSRPVEAAG